MLRPFSITKNDNVEIFDAKNKNKVHKKPEKKHQHKKNPF